MARNSAGTYSLPASTSPGTNPVVPGTSIGSTWANSTLGDVATELSDSLSRSGKGGMTAPLRTADGAVGAPAQSFTSETGSGWFRHAAGELRLAILGVYRIAVTAVGVVVNGTFNAIGAATFGSTVVASGTIEATGALKSKDTGGTGKIVSVSAPVGLAADYGMTFPAALPASTLPVTLSAAGVLATAQLGNAQQNFGTPSAATDVVVLSYLDTSNSAVSNVHANLSNAPSTTRSVAATRAWFTSAANSLSATGAVVGTTATGNTASASVLFRIATGYRFPATSSSVFILPLFWTDASAANVLKAGAFICNNATGDVYFFDGAGGDLANGDIIYIQSGASWTPTA